MATADRDVSAELEKKGRFVKWWVSTCRLPGATEPPQDDNCLLNSCNLFQMVTMSHPVDTTQSVL